VAIGGTYKNAEKDKNRKRNPRFSRCPNIDTAKMVYILTVSHT